MDKSCTVNPHEELARQIKVGKLVEQARTARDGAGFSAAELEGFTLGQRDLLAQAAGAHPPSDETWGRVVAVVRAAEDRAAEWAAGADPWEGIK